MQQNQKITVISFDNWNYDFNIIVALQAKGIEANHINIGKFKHKNIFDRLKNMLSKIFFNKNLKHIKRQDFIVNKLKEYGNQNQILVINPELIDLNYHLEIKNHTEKYIAYLYDSVARCSIEHLLNGVFDEIFSFDTSDCEKFEFEKTNNYIYLDKNTATPTLDYKYKVATVSSFDKRFLVFNAVANELVRLKQNFNFIFVSRNINFKLLKCKQKINPNLQFQSSKIELKTVNKLYNNSLAILDIVQGNQTGLSFRVFEAMALQKKIITDNQSIINYDFYNSTNILIININNLLLNEDFFNTPYQPIPDEIYKKYTINTWVETIFKL